MKIAVIPLVLLFLGALPLPVARGLGAIIGQLAWWLGSRGARTAVINLKQCFPQMSAREQRRLAARSMRHWGMTLCEIPAVWRRGQKSLAWIRHIEGLEKIKAAEAQGKGVMIVSPHLGNWEMVGYWAGTLGQITTLYQPPRRFAMDEYLQKARTKTGAVLVPTNSRGVASLIKALKRGEYIGVLPDMEPEANSGEFAPFFGVPALTMTLLHNLEQRTGAAIFVGFAKRVPGGFDLVFIEPSAKIRSENAQQSLSELNQTIATLVAMAPEQYQWEYKRFKRRPEGLAKLYK